MDLNGKLNLTEKAIKSRNIISALAGYFRQQSKLVTDRALFVNELASERESNPEADVNIAPNGKPYRTYNKTEMLKELGLQRGSRQLDNLVKRLGLDPANSPYGGQWTVNLLERNQIKEAYGLLEPFERAGGQKCAIFGISNLKGGSGKTTLSTLLATGLAIESRRKFRIAVIDLDPQGTATRILLPNVEVGNGNADYVSVGDLLVEERLEIDYSDDEQYKEVVRSAFLETNADNLKVLPANIADTDFELQSKHKAINDRSYASFKPLQRLITQIEDDFDLIIIDTPPALNEICIAAHFVSTHLFIPLRASENDRDSTGKYLGGFEMLYDLMLAYGHQGYEEIKLVPTAIDRRSSSELEVEQSLRLGLMSYVTESIAASEAIKNTNKDLNTIFDISPSCYSGKNSTCESAQSSSLVFIRSIEVILSNYWKLGVHI
ncbi:ParA family protein [Vibrio gangliei]|uniref:ParA family protein n=1 Tax=Vibrio gangliei TaxID=2077090 RepID=UPI000D017032|nr:ParA family protein [Vibrio gangliei]